MRAAHLDGLLFPFGPQTDNPRIYNKLPVTSAPLSRVWMGMFVEGRWVSSPEPPNHQTHQTRAKKTPRPGSSWGRRHFPAAPLGRSRLPTARARSARKRMGAGRMYWDLLDLSPRVSHHGLKPECLLVFAGGIESETRVSWVVRNGFRLSAA